MMEPPEENEKRELGMRKKTEQLFNKEPSSSIFVSSTQSPANLNLTGSKSSNKIYMNKNEKNNWDIFKRPTHPLRNEDVTNGYLRNLFWKK